MGQTIFKPREQVKSLNNQIVIQISKKQLVVFFQIVVMFAMVALNIIAILISSPFLKELFISQSVLLLVFFIKTSKSNNISKY
ncbi:MAG: hypothetical protein WAO74_06465 [Polaribacter sp.]|uniref:hypothetical protein n=1 Tax=Polaribacter sp. TaxID=1920175 RepID=UPI003BB0EE0D